MAQTYKSKYEKLTKDFQEIQSAYIEQTKLYNKAGAKLKLISGDYDRAIKQSNNFERMYHSAMEELEEMTNDRNNALVESEHLTKEADGLKSQVDILKDENAELKGINEFLIGYLERLEESFKTRRALLPETMETCCRKEPTHEYSQETRIIEYWLGLVYEALQMEPRKKMQTDFDIGGDVRNIYRSYG